MARDQVIAFLAAVLGCTSADPPEPVPALPETTDKIEMVVLISVDTLRADFLGCYGQTSTSSRRKAPCFDAT